MGIYSAQGGSLSRLDGDFLIVERDAHDAVGDFTTRVLFWQFLRAVDLHPRKARPRRTFFQVELLHHFLFELPALVLRVIPFREDVDVVPIVVAPAVRPEDLGLHVVVGRAHMHLIVWIAVPPARRDLDARGVRDAVELEFGIAGRAARRPVILEEVQNRDVRIFVESPSPVPRRG